MTSSSSRSDVVTPVGRAWDHMRQLLFRPFDLARWLAIGFTAWLATLGQASGGGSYNFPGGGGDNRNPEVREAFLKAKDWILDNLMWLVPVALVSALILFTLWLVFLWLSSRGRFMFLHNVITGRADVVAPWNTFAAHGNSLFVFRLVLVLGFTVACLPLLAAAVWAGVQLVQQRGEIPASIAVAIIAGLGLLAVGVVYSVVAKLTDDFVVPIMWRGSPSCRAAWSKFLGLVQKSAGPLVLYLLFQILLWMGAGILILIAILLTCCIAGCLLALPFLGTVFMLPVLVFFRLYSLHFLAQQGPEWDVFRPTAVDEAKRA